MSSVPFLDIPYSVAPGVLLSVKTANSMVIAGAVAPLELPLEFVRVLMAFASTRTARQAFEDWDLDVSMEEFGDIVRNLCKWRLLTQETEADDGESLQQLLDARVFGDPAALEKLGAWMRHGRLVVIRDALPASLAEAVHDDLCTAKTWSTIEAGHDFFHFRTSALSRMEDNGSALAQCARVFKSKATRHFIAELSGHDCAGEPGIAATWYRPYDYALPHEDATASAARSVAFVWYLTKDWKQEWGGSFFWCPTGQYISPQFNMLLMFNVIKSNMHLVCPVAPTATGRRLTVSGFWHHSKAQPVAAPVPSGAFLSRPSYGSPAPADTELGSVIVL